ncbi:LysR family transcriptional regulator [Methylosinus sp. R-45379]|uniref:LysR family transcriptional regulator n=1 Tax=Methylosinus sp. R-45379 TaxID=980563 RepID=UPI0007C98108|nr:LysR family transcriptional regulator [Methylosinus sp. R-45379]OAI30595.1 LysR family transcriptional regulator [Methylosinus sp. R-45379]
MTELRDFDLNLLVAFKYLMEELNVSRAAQKMFVSPSAMSHVLQRLRQQLDDPVLVKTPQGMAPTQRALDLLEPVDVVLREVEKLIQPPEAFSAETSRRRLVIATTDYIELILLPSLTETLGQLAPNIEIFIREPHRKLPERALAENPVDFMIGFDVNLTPPPHIRCETLFDDRMTSVVRRDHPTLTGDDMTFDQFMAGNHMLISRRESGTGLIDDWLEQRGMSRKIGLILPNFLSAPLIVASTDHILSLPQRLAERFVELAPLKILPTPIDLPLYKLVMSWHPLQEKDPAHAWLREQIMETCRRITQKRPTLALVSDRGNDEKHRIDLG